MSMPACATSWLLRGFRRVGFILLFLFPFGMPAGAPSWENLSRSRPPSPSDPHDGDAKAYWRRLAAEARAYRDAHPDGEHARAARGLELRAEIEAQEDQLAESPDTMRAVDAYVDDTANPTRDRLTLKIASDQAGLRRGRYASRQDLLDAHEAHARRLIALFPDEMEGYGYLLAMAKAESSARARRIATGLLASPASPAVKEGARSVVARLDLVGAPLVLDAAGTAVAEARGHPLVVYSWTTADQGFLDVVRRLAEHAEARFIGINLDSDAESARSMAVTLGLPGLQIFDGGGLDGPSARQLHLTFATSLYLVDPSGIVRDVDGHDDPEARLAGLTSNQEDRP